MRNASTARLTALLAVFWSVASCAAPSDAPVIEAVLSHFANRTDTMAMHENGIILVDPQTTPWTAERLRFYSLTQRKSDQCGVAPALFEALVDRNGTAQPAVALLTQSNRWRLAGTDDDRRVGHILDASAAGDPIKTIVRLSTPAYSPNGDTAFVLFLFRWSIHGAAALYVAERSGEGWDVKCSDLVFYP